MRKYFLLLLISLVACVLNVEQGKTLKFVVVTGTHIGKVGNKEAFEERMKDWEWQWVNGTEVYSDQSQGNSIMIASKMYHKYNKKIKAVYHF